MYDVNMVGTKIREIRKAKKMTQQELADLIDRERSVVVRYEQDAVDIPVSVLSAIARALKVKEAAFFGKN